MGRLRNVKYKGVRSERVKAKRGGGMRLRDSTKGTGVREYDHDLEF